MKYIKFCNLDIDEIFHFFKGIRERERESHICDFNSKQRACFVTRNGQTLAGINVRQKRERGVTSVAGLHFGRGNTGGTKRITLESFTVEECTRERNGSDAGREKKGGKTD